MRNIVVMAHDNKKPDLATFLKEREEWFWGRTLIATGKSAVFLEEAEIKVSLKHLSQGKSGGYEEITTMLKAKEIDMIIFFIDPEVKHPHHADIQLLLDTCYFHNVPMANNPASAELMLIGIIRKQYLEKK